MVRVIIGNVISVLRASTRDNLTTARSRRKKRRSARTLNVGIPPRVPRTSSATRSGRRGTRRASYWRRRRRRSSTCSTRTTWCRRARRPRLSRASPRGRTWSGRSSNASAGAANDAGAWIVTAGPARRGARVTTESSERVHIDAARPVRNVAGVRSVERARKGTEAPWATARAASAEIRRATSPIVGARAWRVRTDEEVHDDSAGSDARVWTDDGALSDTGDATCTNGEEINYSWASWLPAAKLSLNTVKSEEMHAQNSCEVRPNKRIYPRNSNRSSSPCKYHKHYSHSNNR